MREDTNDEKKQEGTGHKSVTKIVCCKKQDIYLKNTDGRRHRTVSIISSAGESKQFNGAPNLTLSLN
jgi:hypothetical protein